VWQATHTWVATAWPLAKSGLNAGLELLAAAEPMAAASKRPVSACAESFMDQGSSLQNLSILQ
jgi:hypothetical protein